MNEHNRNQIFAALLTALAIGLIVFIAWCLTLLTGCSLMEKTQTSSGTSAERLAAANALVLKRALEGDKAPNIFLSVSVSGTSNTVSVPMPGGLGGRRSDNLSINANDRQNASSDESFKESLKTALPWSIALVVTGAGLLLCVYAYKAAKRASPAVAAALNTAETAIAAQLHTVDDKLARAKTAEEQADLALQARALEKERAKLRAKP